jgi:hypothetical protein
VKAAAGGDYTAGATIGQPDVGEQTGGDYTVLSGFWPAAAQMACANDADCDDGDVCTWDQCVDFWCVHEDVIYGDVNANGVLRPFPRKGRGMDTPKLQDAEISVRKRPLSRVVFRGPARIE